MYIWSGMMSPIVASISSVSSLKLVDSNIEIPRVSTACCNTPRLQTEMGAAASFGAHQDQFLIKHTQQHKCSDFICDLGDIE